MKLDSIKVNKIYLFEKNDNGYWCCRNHNLMGGDMEIINKVMPNLKKIEEILK